ncbi:hypothetical protein [Guptibacillus algicola]|uniref:hypothetical protein n=1 Tax=Guptibacillus algicola TaxID=225844 RepID=UPI001CD35A93|nr:hypothetical protein [Alkalihalobacillus algicola]MCA0987136.1 hypothetical protein [Alkalihalobacillus algicola]
MSSKSNKVTFSKFYWVMNLSALLLFIIVGIILIMNDFLLSFTILAIVYGFMMMIGNQLYIHFRKKASKSSSV